MTGSLADTLGEYNPLRYRGYVYDTETGFYYLQSRYYDPELGRFINADAYAATGQGLLGNNMFSYCLNNPVCRVDISGNISEEAAQQIIKENKDAIIAAGEEFGVDPVIIACCIYTELVTNYDWLDMFADYICFFLDTSIGIGQVRISTAIMVENAGYIEATRTYNNYGLPGPGCYVTRNQMIAAKLLDDINNIRYVAAYLAYWQDQWKDVNDISNRPEILATLYNLGDRARGPNLNPVANDFGNSAKSNYELLRKILFE